MHTGETSHTGAEGVVRVIEELKPARIGHGIAAAQSEEAMKKLVEHDIVLELCPSSNLRTHAVADLEDIRTIFTRLRQNNVRTTVNTDGTYMLGTTLRAEFDLLLDANILNPSDAQRCIETARQATFLR